MDVGTTAAGTLRRDMRVIGLVSGAHFLSHFYQLVLPPLYLALRAEFDVSFAALGALTGTLFVASGVSQPVAGFLVDRYGARSVLLAGLALFAGATAALGLVPSFWLMFPLAAIAGLGNAVFHPADFPILNASVDPRRLGRAYSVHGIAGNLGWIAAVPSSLFLGEVFGWRVALIVLGCLGLAATVYLASQRDAMVDHRHAKSERAPPTSLAEDVRMLMAPHILLSFSFFALMSMALIGVQTFVPQALTQFHSMPIELAGGALTAFLIGGVLGTLAGGVVADRFRHPETIICAAMTAFAAIFFVLVIPGLAHVLILSIFVITGMLMGLAGPPRDMLVRDRTPAGAAGKVYGFIYAGLDAGAAVMPPVFGWLLDRGEPRFIFVLMSLVIALSVLTVLQLRRPAAVAATTP